MFTVIAVGLLIAFYILVALSFRKMEKDDERRVNALLEQVKRIQEEPFREGNHE